MNYRYTKFLFFMITITVSTNNAMQSTLHINPQVLLRERFHKKFKQFKLFQQEVTQSTLRICITLMKYIRNFR